MKWFRLYSSVLHDPKVQRLSPTLFKHWVNLLCLASEQDDRGLLPCVDDIAFALRIKPSEAAQVMTQLRRAGLVDTTSEGRDFPHNWPQRQRESDDVATRVRRHRERKAAENTDSLATGNGYVTLPETFLKRPVDTDTESDTDSEIPVDTSGGETSRESMAPVASAAPTRGALALSPALPSPVQSIKPQAPARAPAVIVPLPSAHQPRAQPAQPAQPARSHRPPDPLWDACVAACDGEGQGPSNSVERGKWNKGLAALRQSGATPEEIAIRAERYRRRYGEGIALNPMSLASNWTVLRQEVTHHANNNTTTTAATSASAAASSSTGRSAGSGGGSSRRRSALPADNLPDADELRAWARRQQALGVNVSGL